MVNNQDETESLIKNYDKAPFEIQLFIVKDF